MNSYFNGKLKSMQQQLASAANKYIPKDIKKNVHTYLKKKAGTAQDDGDDSDHEESPQIQHESPQPQREEETTTGAQGATNTGGGKRALIKQKIGSFMKKKGNNNEESKQSKIDEKFLYVSQTSSEFETTPMLPPTPEEACNEVMRKLLSSKQLEAQGSLKVKETGISILRALNQKNIDLIQLQRITFNGIPDEIKGLRPLIWRILLGHLPLDTALWDETLDKSRETYEIWRQELIVKPTTKALEEEKESKKKIIDHPLSTNFNSQWHRFFQDQDLWDEIEKDVKRTRTDMSFFYKAVDETQNSQIDRLMKQAECKKAELSAADREAYIETHSDVLARVLFIYAKLNPGVKYVQGMNEVLAVIYYCFWSFSDFSVISRDNLESDLFFCFTNLMIEIRDGFIRDMDQEHTGISGKVNTFAEILKQIDPKIYNNLELQGVNHQFYSLRWFMLLMCQEFDMSNVIRLWDTLFSDPERFNFFNFVCVATVLTKRDIVMDGEFADCMETLQRATDTITDIRTLLNQAKEVCQKYIKIKREEENWVEVDQE